MKKVKVFIAMIAVALGGLIIWSCTQDEMENGQVTYRYSAEEIATLRAMAEKYGVPEVVFPTESSNKLLAQAPCMRLHSVWNKRSLRRSLCILYNYFETI